MLNTFDLSRKVSDPLKPVQTHWNPSRPTEIYPNPLKPIQAYWTEDEMSLLKLGPKFWLLGRVCEEKFEVDVKETIMKVKWDMNQNVC